MDEPKIKIAAQESPKGIFQKSEKCKMEEIEEKI